MRGCNINLEAHVSMIRSRADDNCNDGDYTRDECCINNAQLLVLFD